MALRRLCVIVLILISTVSFARTPARPALPEAPAECQINAVPDPLLDTVALRKVLNEEVCLQEARNLHAKYFPNPGPSVTRTIAGLHLHGDAEVLRLGTSILGTLPLPSALARAQHCPDMICTLTMIFGSEEGALRALVIAKREGIVPTISQRVFNLLKQDFASVSAFTGAEGVIWTTSELRVMEHAFRALPPSMRRMPRMQTIARVPAGTSMGARWMKDGNDFTVAVAQPLAAEWGSRTLLHELSHHLQGISISSGPKWTRFKELSGWERDPDWERKAQQNTPLGLAFRQSFGWNARKTDACFPSEYAKKNVWEDYADSATEYLMGTPDFAFKCPSKFRYFRDHVFPGFVVKPPVMDCNSDDAN